MSERMTVWQDWLARRAADRESGSLTRRLVPTTGPANPVTVRDGRALINLSSNNYLGLAGHPALAEAVVGSADRGAGAGSSRLVAGHDPTYAALEQRVAEFKGTERALVFGSGYLTNVGVLPALADADTEVFSDRLNHASIVDGVRLSRARHVHRYRHADVDHLERLLRSSAGAAPARRLIVTDTVFSMDGDVAPLAEIVELKDRYEAALLVDEAHAGGVFGPQGRGYVHELGLQGRVELVMGTFSKAFGAYGGYVAGGAAWIEQLVNTSRTVIYSTGLPPAVVDAIDTAIDLVAKADDERRTLLENAALLRSDLGAAGLDTGRSSTQIVPVIVGESAAALALGQRLQDDGVLAVAIREPTVPRGAARVRLSPMATHTADQLGRATGVIVRAAAAL